MGSFKELVDYASEHGFSPMSKVIQITHQDFDGSVSVINMLNYLRDDRRLKYIHTLYDKVNIFAKDAMNDRIRGISDADFVILTDISILPETAKELLKYDHPRLLVIDHHETAFPLNDLSPACYVDTSGKFCGAELTLAFLKQMGYSDKGLNKLNKIAGQYDLWTWTKPENRKFTVAGVKTGLGEMVNRLYYSYGYGEQEQFINRWVNGWEDGFTKRELEWLKQDYQSASDYINTIEEFDLIEGKVAVVIDDKVKYTNDINMHFQEKKGYEVIVMYSTNRNKVSVRGAPSFKGNIGATLREFDPLGGGHALAGGCSIQSNQVEPFFEHLEKAWR